MNDDIEIIRSNKGGMKIIHRGYMYTVHKKRQGGGIRWRCTQRSLHCKGSISTGNGPPNVNMPHNHIPDPHSVALARCRQIEEEFTDVSSLLETEYEDTKDAMPFHHGVQLAPKIHISSVASPLQSQPLSPTKLKVTRQPNRPQTSTPKIIEIPAPSEEVCLRWNSHHSNMQSSFPLLLEMEKYVDVTLIAEGQMLKCHRLILSSCSPYFEDILSGISPLQHPVIILNGVPFRILKMLTEFMYSGEVNIEQHKVPELLDIAEILKVKGLAGKSNSAENDKIKKENDVKKKPSENNTTRKQQLPNIFAHKMPLVPKLEDSPINDPLQLLETKFLEVPLSKPKDNKSLSKKIMTKKLRKRKSSDDESTPSPPIYPVRRGTRSRPYVKVPKYYDYEDIVKPTRIESPQDTEPFSPVNIKIEPIDHEQNDAPAAKESTSICDMISEYTDINDIASKLQSLEKAIDIQPIPPILAQVTGKELVPYKIKIKSLSSMSETNSPSTSVKICPVNSKAPNIIEKTNSDPNRSDNASQILISKFLNDESGNKNMGVDITLIDTTDKLATISDIQETHLPKVFDRDKQ